MEQVLSHNERASGAVVGPRAARSSRDRQREALLAFGRRSNEQPTAAMLLQDAMALLVEVFGTDLGLTAWVKPGTVAADFTACRLEPRGKPHSVLSRAINVDPLRSVVGMALQQAAPILLSDFFATAGAEDPILAELGVVSGLVVPLPIDAAPCGAVGVCSARPREFDADEIHFAETIAHLAAAAIGRARAEQRLQHQQAMSNAVLDSIDDLVVMLDSEGRVTWLNRAAQQTTGLTLSAVQGHLFTEILVAGNEAPALSGLLRQLSGETKQMRAQLVSKAGMAVDVEWSFRPVMLGDGTLDAIAATGKLTLRDSSADCAEQGAFSAVDAEAAGREMRRSPRRAFNFRQAIAPMYGSILPTPNKFFEVACIDISAGGVSFYLDRAPDFTTLLVALGREPKVTYFTARVMRVSEVREAGHLRYSVGCQFIGRVHM